MNGGIVYCVLVQCCYAVGEEIIKLCQGTCSNSRCLARAGIDRCSHSAEKEPVKLPRPRGDAPTAKFLGQKGLLPPVSLEGLVFANYEDPIGSTVLALSQTDC